MTLAASWDALVDVRPMGQHCCQMTVVWSAAARVLVDENERAIRVLAGVPRGRRGNPMQSNREQRGPGASMALAMHARRFVGVQLECVAVRKHEKVCNGTRHMTFEMIRNFATTSTTVVFLGFPSCVKSGKSTYRP